MKKVKRIKIYSTTTCPYCQLEKMWLKEKGIEFEDTLVDINPLETQKMIEKTGQMGVPVTEIEFEDGGIEYVIGFNRERLQELFEIS